jgi:hypothetical protein
MAMTSFLPTADEVWRLQRGGDEECLFFQRAVNGGKVITDNGTRQGIYVMSPSGKTLARVNSLNAEKVLTMMKEGLAKWETMPDQERWLPDGFTLQGAERWESSLPKDGLRLERIVRDIPEDGSLDGERQAKSNVDSVWFSKDEVWSILEAAAKGGWQPLPTKLAQRLACFSLVDNVYGQCIPFDPADLQTLDLEVRLLASKNLVAQFEFRGRTLAVEDGAWGFSNSMWKPKKNHPHAMQTTLLGWAELDLVKQKFSSFDLLALGRRSGFTELNSRRFRPEPGAIGFSFHLDSRPWAPAPTFLSLYDAGWVKAPSLGRELFRD